MQLLQQSQLTRTPPCSSFVSVQKLACANPVRGTAPRPSVPPSPEHRQRGAVTTEAGTNGAFIAQESRHGSWPWKESDMVWTVLSHLFCYLLF